VNLYQDHSILKIKASEPDKKAKKPGKSTGKALREDDATKDGIEKPVTSSMVDVEFWVVVERYVRQLRSLKDRHMSKISDYATLSDEYCFMFLATAQLLHEGMAIFLHRLNTLVRPSPQMRNFFIRETMYTAENQYGDEKSDYLTRVDKKNLPPDWSLAVLRNLDDLSNVTDPSHLMYHMQRIQREVDADTSCEKYSGLFQDRVSSLYTIFHCMNQINLYFPWAATFKLYVGRWLSDINDHVEKDIASFKQYQTLHISTAMLELGDPSYDRFRYPADKPQTRAHVDAMRKAEENLDIFWGTIDRHMGDSKLVPSYLPQLLGSGRELQRTLEYDPAQETSRPHTIFVAKKPLSDYYRELQLATERTTDNAPPTAPKEKVKSRGPIQELDESNFSPVDPRTDDTVTAEPAEKFAVPEKWLKVFRALFYTIQPQGSSLERVLPGDGEHRICL
jgi:hypothetical protein